MKKPDCVWYIVANIRKEHPCGPSGEETRIGTQEFRDWAQRVAGEHGYSVRFLPVGLEDEDVRSPTQMGVFEQGQVDAIP